MELGVKERDRISLLRQAHDGLVTVSEAAARAEVTTRHLRRLLRRFETEGDAVAVHGLRGRRSNRALPREVRERALAVAADPMYRDFGPTLLAEHLELRCELRVSADTLRRWMLDAGLWERARKRAKHRSRRPRRAALGELAQWDSSVHPWLEDRAEGSQALISIHDDATSRLMFARFVERDNGAENRRAMMAYLRRHGRPLAAYADHAGHFGQWQSRTGRRTDTIIARALDALGIELILAGSPQAKGRVERAFGTAQDRLVKEMRVAGIDTLDAANRHLEAVWIPFWNARFAVEPREPLDAHRRLPPGRRPAAALRRDRGSRRRPRLHGPLREPALADSGGGGAGGSVPAPGWSSSGDSTGSSDSAPANGTSKSFPRPARRGGPAAGRRSPGGPRRSRRSSRPPPGPEGTTTAGSPAAWVPTRSSRPGPGIRTAAPASAAAGSRPAPAPFRERPADGPPHHRAADSRSPGRARPSLRSGVRPCRNLPARAYNQPVGGDISIALYPRTFLLRFDTGWGRPDGADGRDGRPDISIAV